MSNPCNHIPSSSFSQVLVATAISILLAVGYLKIVLSLFLSDLALNCANHNKLAYTHMYRTDTAAINFCLPNF